MKTAILFIFYIAKSEMSKNFGKIYNVHLNGWVNVFVLEKNILNWGQFTENVCHINDCRINTL